MPAGMIPAAFAAESAETEIEGKEGLIVLNKRPINAETPAHLLDDAITPNHRMFVRNNGIPPHGRPAPPGLVAVLGELLLGLADAARHVRDHERWSDREAEMATAGRRRPPRRRSRRVASASAASAARWAPRRALRRVCLAGCAA